MKNPSEATKRRRDYPTDAEVAAHIAGHEPLTCRCKCRHCRPAKEQP